MGKKGFYDVQGNSQSSNGKLKIFLACHCEMKYLGLKPRMVTLAYIWALIAIDFETCPVISIRPFQPSLA